MDLFEGGDDSKLRLYVHQGQAAHFGTVSDTDLIIETNDVSRIQVHNGGDFEVKHNQYLTGSVDRRIKLGDSGVSGVSTSNNAVYVRGNDDHLILNCAGNGHISFTDNGSEIARLTDGNLQIDGNIEHSGLTMTSGTDVDQLYTTQKSLTVTKSWLDTGIIFNNLTTGSYIVQVHVNNHSVGGQQYNEYYTGTMSWFSSTTNSTSTDEIVLHRAGHAPNAGIIFLRTARVAGNTSPNVHLEIKSSLDTTGNSTYTFKFRRLI